LKIFISNSITAAMTKVRSYTRLHLAALSAAVLLLFTSCGGTPEPAYGPRPVSYRYVPSANMSSSRIAARDRDFSVALPQGWKETSDPANAPAVILWMVREDYAASISFTNLQMDPALYMKLKRDGLVSIAKVGLSLKKQRARDSVSVVQAPESFTLNGRNYAAYEYSIDGGRSVARVVVFDSGSRFIECALMPAAGDLPQSDRLRLFETQQSVLASLTTP
jgi:hypothetical protein